METDYTARATVHSFQKADFTTTTRVNNTKLQLYEQA
jgi:hypothetical protein